MAQWQVTGCLKEEIMQAEGSTQSTNAVILISEQLRTAAMQKWLQSLSTIDRYRVELSVPLQGAQGYVQA